MYKDTRLGGVEKWYHTAPEGANMRIPDEMTKSVCFLCVQLKGGENSGKYKPIGTGTFIGVRQDDWTYPYLVTSRHVVDIREDLLPIYARVNNKNGSSRYVELPPIKSWAKFHDASIDVAMIPWYVSDEEMVDGGVDTVGSLALLSDETMAKHSIGLGDELTVIGLHVHHSGSKQNVPILRTGVLSMLPTELIYDTTNKGYHHCYFAEVRSIGGLSGSPVYVFLNNERIYASNLEEGIRWQWLMIGIIRGHHKLPKSMIEPDKDSDFIEDNWLGIGIGEDLNVGIALITPSQYITTLIMSPKQEERRQEIAKRHDEKFESTLDVDIPDSNEFTGDVFQDALKKASRKISEPVSETKETSE